MLLEKDITWGFQSTKDRPHMQVEVDSSHPLFSYLIGAFSFDDLRNRKTDIKRGSLSGTARLNSGYLRTVGTAGVFECGENLSPASGTNFSVVCQFYWDGASEFKRLFFSSRSTISSPYGVSLQLNSSGQISIAYYDGTGTGPTDRRTLLSTSGLPSPGFYTIAAQKNGLNTGSIFANGKSYAATYSGTGGAYAAGTNNADVGALYQTGTWYYSTQRIGMVAVFDTALSDTWLRSLSNSPYQLFRSANGPLFAFGTAGTAAYTLTAEGTSYALTGSEASLLANRKFTADSASYSLTGSAANLLAGWKVTADAGSYSWTGSDAGLLADRILSAETTSYAWTGQDVTLTYTPTGGYTLSAESASFSWTGADASLLRGALMAAGSASFTLTGSDVALLAGRLLAAEAAGFTWSGTDATFSRTYSLAAESTSYTWTGAAVTLTYSNAAIPADTAYLVAEDRLAALVAADRKAHLLH